MGNISPNWQRLKPSLLQAIKLKNFSDPCKNATTLRSIILLSLMPSILPHTELSQ